jgi:hypothetical protein
MGADQSKTPKSLSQSIDYLAANYILTSNFQDLKDLSDASSCKELVVLTSEVLDKYMTERDVAFLQQRLEGSEEKNFMTKKSLAYFNEEKLDDMDVKSDLQKKRMCLGIAKFYIRIFHVFNAIAHTVNPEYTWVDETGQTRTVGYEQKGDIPKNANYTLTKMNLCSEKMNALVDKTNLDIILEDDNSKNIEIKPKFCGINLNDKNGTQNVDDEPGMPELEKLYYDQYNYSTGKFQSMSPEMKEVYEEDVKTLYKAFVHDKKSMPENITKFSDIQLRDFENIVQCQPNGVFTKSYTGSLKEKQFQAYADNIRLMKQNTKENQEALMKILDSLFAFTPDPQTKGKKMITIHPDLTEKTLDSIVSQTREAILKLYTTCEKDFYKGLQLFEAIVWKQMLDTSVKQIDNLQDDINKEMAADPGDAAASPGQGQSPGSTGQPNAASPAAAIPGAPGSYYNNQQNYNIKQEVLPTAKKEDESESDSEDEDKKSDKKQQPYEKIVETTKPSNFNPAANPMIPNRRNQTSPDVTWLRTVHNLEREVPVGPQALSPVKTEKGLLSPVKTEPDAQQKNNEDSAKVSESPPGDNSMENQNNFIYTTPKKNLQMRDFVNQDTSTPYVQNLLDEPDVYRQEQDGSYCGKHAINNLLGREEISNENMKEFCGVCSNDSIPVCKESGEDCDISVLIYILAQMDKFKLIVMPPHFKDNSRCLKDLPDVYYDRVSLSEDSSDCILPHIKKNTVGCIVHKNNHFAVYKKIKNESNFVYLDSKNVDENYREYTPQNLANLLFDSFNLPEGNVNKINGMIIVKDKEAIVRTCIADEEQQKGNLNKVNQELVEKIPQNNTGESVSEQEKSDDAIDADNIQDDTTETDKSKEADQGDTTETKDKEISDKVAEEEKDNATEGENVEKATDSAQKANEAPKKSAFGQYLDILRSRNEGTVGHETQNSSSNQNEEKSADTAEEENENSITVAAKNLLKADKDKARQAAEKDAMAKENAREFIENLKKAKETQNPPNVEDQNAQEIAKSKNTGTGIINGIGNFFTGLVGSNPEDNTHTQKETAQRSGNDTPVVSDSDSDGEETIEKARQYEQQAQKPAVRGMTTRSRANETETSQNNQPKTKASAPPNNDADVIVEDVDPLEEIKTDLENEGCDKYVSKSSQTHIDKCVNMLERSITKLEELHGNSNSNSRYKAKITNYLKTIRPVKKTYLGQQSRKRKEKSGGARSRRKKHTKKHRKNSRRKSKSMRRVKKLKK